jgi:hypothetical protein
MLKNSRFTIAKFFRHQWNITGKLPGNRREIPPNNDHLTIITIAFILSEFPIAGLRPPAGCTC